MTKQLLREILVHAGALYIAGWLAFPLVMLFEQLFPPAVVSGEWAMFLLALRGEVPFVIAWVACAALVASITTVQRPLRWAAAFAAALVLLRFAGWRWNADATVADRAAWIFPSLLGGGAVIWTYVTVVRRRRSDRGIAFKNEEELQ